jgi:HEAT repeat protein
MALPPPEEIVALIRDHGRDGRRQIETAFSPGDTAILCRAIREADDARVRAVLCNILASLADPEALPCLLDTLDDADPGVVAAAEDAIGNCAYDQPLEPELERRLGEALLDRFEDPASPREVRTGAEYALGLLRYRPALPALTAALEDPEPIVRWNAAEALTHIADPAARSALEARAAREEHPRVQRFIGVALDELRRAT